MAYEKKDNSGTLGVNKRKEKDTHPDQSGTCVIDGVEYWISGWIKQNGSTGEEFLSLAFKRKDAQQERSAAPASGFVYQRPQAQKPLESGNKSGIGETEFEGDLPF